ncbi:MAG TPA: hypothetical protein VNT76_01570, partial [Candidatus Binatus sp.]|nr:hypothetical protein [Candidatus Binatus sp.]
PKRNPGFKRGIYIGSVADGKITAFLPGLGTDPATQSVGEAVAADGKGAIYWAETNGMIIRRFIKK